MGESTLGIVRLDYTEFKIKHTHLIQWIDGSAASVSFGKKENEE
jgi:hypothetical protein